MKLENDDRLILIDLVDDKIKQIQDLIDFDRENGQYLSFISTMEKRIKILENLKKTLNE
jgi:hypothetical protein